MRACFFSTAPLEQLEREQYSIADIRILRELGFEVTIANRYANIPGNCDLYFSWWASGSIFPLIKASLRRRPIIVVAGGNEAVRYRDSASGQALGYLNAPLHKRIATRLVLRLCTVLTVVSRFMVPHVVALSGGREPLLVPLCVDTERFVSGDAAREFVTTICRLDEEPARVKRVETFIRAIPFVLQRHPGQRFLVIGFHGDAYARLRALAAGLGVEGVLEFVGAIRNEEVVRYLQRSKCYVQVSDTETFGLAVAEAMSSETPVVVSRAGALSELTRGVGVVVDQNSPHAVAEGLCQLLAMDEGSRGELGRQCRAVVLDRYSYEARRNSIADIVRKLGLQPGAAAHGRPLPPEGGQG